MKQPRVCVAVDLGNTAAKWAIRVGDANAPALQRVPLRTADWPQQLIRSVQQQAGDAAAYWRIAAVNTPARQRLVEHLVADRSQPDVTVITRAHVPMATCLPQPERIGIDRLLAIWQASRSYPAQRIVVVDAGSAITIDCASEAGEFLGGVILPGLMLQFDSLARGTDALPAIEPPEASSDGAGALPVPATDTVTAIRSGIMLGTAAAIDRLIARSLDGGSHQVILTGGDARRLSSLVTHPHVVLDRLVIDAILAAEIKGAGANYR